MNETLLSIENVTLCYGDRVILTDVSLSVDSGDTLLLHGPNGGGKTTLLRLMAGLLRPTKGRIVRRPGLTIGYLPQYRRIDRQFPITVGEVVLSGLVGRKPLLRRFSPEYRAATDEMLRRMQIDAIADHSIDSLSGGQWQRTLLARALVSRPDLLLLDEPDTHLDGETRQLLYDILDEERGHRAIVIVSHDENLLDRG